MQPQKRATPTEMAMIRGIFNFYLGTMEDSISNSSSLNTFRLFIK